MVHAEAFEKFKTVGKDVLTLKAEAENKTQDLLVALRLKNQANDT